MTNKIINKTYIKTHTKLIRDYFSHLTFPIYYLELSEVKQSKKECSSFFYSLHIEYEDKSIEHKELDIVDNSDSYLTLASILCKDIPNNVSILSSNIKMQKKIIKDLAIKYESLSPNLISIYENSEDLHCAFTDTKELF